MMRLSGTYTLSLNGKTFVAHNAVTDAGLVIAARLMTGELQTDNVGIGLKDDGASSPGDTLVNHPGWNVLSQTVSTSLASLGARVQTPVMDVPIPQDCVVAGCFLTVGGVLFSVAEFEPEGVIQGDVMQVQYALDLTR